MSKITFMRDDITYGKYVSERESATAILVPQGKYTHLVFGITYVPAADGSDGSEMGSERMAEHYEAERIEILGNPDYPAIVSAVIRQRYSADEETATINNYLTAPTDEHKADFAEYQQWRKHAKKIAKEVLGIPVTAEEILAEKSAAIDAETDKKILSGHVWGETPIWLSSENQFNYKAAYDIAVQTNGTNLPITFKLGEKDGVTVFHTFETVLEIQSFYLSCVEHINKCLNEGWQKKEALKADA